MHCPHVEHAFAPRPTLFEGVRNLAGWRIKQYAITLPGETLDRAPFDAGFRFAAESLPQPPVAHGRFGVGFAICHQGRGINYLVLCWWSRENELPLRVFVREHGETKMWRPARGEESVCVWDLEVINRERDAYVRTILSKTGAPDIETYLTNR